MESIKQLRKICQHKEEKEHISLRVYRTFSIYLTRIFLSLGLTPNSITIIGFFIGIVGGIFYLYGYFITGSILFLVFYIFDFIDGEVARYRKTPSNLGAWLDIITAHLLYPYLFLTLGIGIFWAGYGYFYIILGALAGIAKLIERSPSKGPARIMEQSMSIQEAEGNSLKIWLGHLAKFAVFLPLVLIFSLGHLEKLFLWLITFYLLLLALSKVVLTGWRIYRREVVTKPFRNENLDLFRRDKENE